MMNPKKLAPARALLLTLLAACSLTACVDDDPCDPGQVVKLGQCYPKAMSSGGSSSGGTDMGGAPEVTAGAPGGSSDATFGSPCEDTTDSSDCGEDAPVCADLSPLGQDIMCTQLDCAEGEANAGVCPSGFTCFAVSGYPSLCIRE